MLADCNRSSQSGALHHFGMGADIDRAMGDINRTALNDRALLDEHARAVADNCDRLADRSADAAGCQKLEIRLNLSAVHGEDVSEMADTSDCKVGNDARGFATSHGYKTVGGVVDGLADGEAGDGFGEQSVRDYVRRNADRVIVVGIGEKRKYFGQIISGDVAVGAGEHALPFLSQGEGADAEFGYRPGIGHGEEIGASVIAINEYIVHYSTVFITQNYAICRNFVVKITTIMTFTETQLSGVWLIEPVRHGDARGYFCETFRRDEFERHIGAVDFVQDNESRSHRGVARGLHYQAGAAAQGKLVRVSEGAVVDVVVDLRRDSATFGRHLSVELSAENGRQMFVPRGFAHGFVVMSESAMFQYKVDNLYCPSAERCIRFDDPELAIEFPIPVNELLFSDKDLHGQSFAEAAGDDFK